MAWHGAFDPVVTGAFPSLPSRLMGSIHRLAPFASWDGPRPTQTGRTSDLFSLSPTPSCPSSVCGGDGLHGWCGIHPYASYLFDRLPLCFSFEFRPTPTQSVSHPTRPSSNRKTSPSLPLCGRVGVWVSRWVGTWGGGCAATSLPCPSPCVLPHE